MTWLHVVRSTWSLVLQPTPREGSASAAPGRTPGGPWQTYKKDCFLSADYLFILNMCTYFFRSFFRSPSSFLIKINRTRFSSKMAFFNQGIKVVGWILCPFSPNDNIAFLESEQMDLAKIPALVKPTSARKNSITLFSPVGTGTG